MFSAFGTGSKIDIRSRVSEKYQNIYKDKSAGSSNKEEIELKFERDEFMNTIRPMAVLGYTKCIAGIRHSERYMYNGVKFTLVKLARSGTRSKQSHF